jgi:signal transduction histidine kinase
VKFQGATSLQTGRTLLWLGAAATVLFAGEAALHAGWPLLTLLALTAAGFAVFGWRLADHTTRGAATGLALLSLAAAIAAGKMAHTSLHANLLQSEAVRAARAERDRLLRSSLAAASRTAQLALDRVGTAKPQNAPTLDDLRAGSEVETAIDITAGDTIVASTGPHRMQPLVGTTPAALISTPFAILLVVRSHRGVRQAEVTLLLDSLPGLPIAGPSLAASAGGGQGVRWTWATSPDRLLEYPSLDAASNAVITAMQPVPPPVPEFVAGEERVARLIVGAGILVLALIVLLTGPTPAIRAGAILVPLWALARADLTSTQTGLNAIRTALAVAALLFLATALWRRPARRNVIGMVAAVLLLATAPPLTVILARLVTPPGAHSLMVEFGWELLIALAAAGLIAVAVAPLRAPGDDGADPVWGWFATAAVVFVGLVGIEAWTPVGWQSWYLPLWLLPIVFFLPVTSPRIRLLAVATTASVLAILASWSVSLDHRMDLARADVNRLNSPFDSTSAMALDQFVATARAAHATRLDRLYAAWSASPLAQEGVPTYLALWSAEGDQREVVALDSLSVGWSELAPLVRFAGPDPKRIGLPLGAGHHEVLILPLAPDTVATVTVGPRSRLLAPTTFGLLVGWRQPESDPPYTVEVNYDATPTPDGIFRRNHRFISADRVITSGDMPPRVVRATVTIEQPQPFLVRAMLGILVDIGVILAVWLALQRILGQPRTLVGPVFQRSYRRTMTGALIVFFIVPAALLTATSVLRLRVDATQQRTAELSSTVREVAAGGGLAQAELRRPSNDTLAVIGDSANAAIGIYQEGRLTAASDPLLAELGYLPPIIDHGTRTPAGLDAIALPPPFPGARLRVGMIGTARPGVLLLTAIPGSDTGLAREQIDQALRLLLVALSGIIASILVAGAIARALGQPIEMLRQAAIAIGRRELPPGVGLVPAEFAPVFGAITQMEDDLRATEAELQAGRARTAAILATVATGVIGIDADTVVTHANPRANELLGREIVIGAPIAPQLSSDWRVLNIGIERLLGLRHHTAENREIQLGEARFAVTLAPLSDGGLVLAITDITESSRAARIVAWGEMARQVAHEIKNPLTPMRLGLQHLRRIRADGGGDLSHAVHETTERLLAEVDRLDRIARSFARYGAPPEETAPLEPIDLAAAATELASLFSLTAERPTVEVSGSAAGPVLSRKEELIQVLLNLLDNARQAGASVVRMVLAGYSLRVTDDGKGISADQIARIFEPAFSTTTSGTGLGLAIVRRLVDGWGATVAVESEPGRGATFTIRFAAGGGGEEAGG